jgi:hypothetical protein
MVLIMPEVLERELHSEMVFIMPEVFCECEFHSQMVFIMPDVYMNVNLNLKRC